MAYVAVPSASTDAGQPTKEELFKGIVSNQDSFNTDIEALKQTSRVDMIDVVFQGDIEDYTEAEILTRVPIFRSPVNLTMTSVIITLLSVSTSGTLEMELEVSTDNGINFNTVLTSTVDLTGLTIGSLSGAVNFINAAAQDINENDMVRIRFTGVQVDQGDFHVSVYGEVK